MKIIISERCSEYCYVPFFDLLNNLFIKDDLDRYVFI